MTLTVREFRPADAKAVADLRRAALPYLLSTPQGIAWDVACAPAAQRLRLFVAELDGRIVGAVRSALLYDSSLPGQSAATPQVHPEHRGRGVGSALLTAAEAHLSEAGATHLYAWAVDEPGSLAFAERRGYRRTRPARFLRLDLRSAGLPPLPSPLPPGVRLCTGADFGADPRPLFEADAEATADEPGEVACDAMAYEDWLLHTWEHPDIDWNLSSVVTVNGDDRGLHPGRGRRSRPLFLGDDRHPTRLPGQGPGPAREDRFAAPRPGRRLHRRLHRQRRHQRPDARHQPGLRLPPVRRRVAVCARSSRGTDRRDRGPGGEVTPAGYGPSRATARPGAEGS